MEVIGKFHATVALSPTKNAPAPNEQEAGWAPDPVCTLEEEKNRLFLLGIEPRFFSGPVSSLVTVLTTLRLHCVVLN